MKIFFWSLMLIASWVAVFFLGGIFKTQNSELGLAITLLVAALLVLGYFLGAKKK